LLVCYLPQVLTNYDSQLYEDPDYFRPERSESPTKEMAEAYISPFLIGARNCPGQALAIAEINSALVSRYESSRSWWMRAARTSDLEIQGSSVEGSKN
jgi:cytochrome P450